MGENGDEDPGRVQRVVRSARLYLAVGLVLLVGGSVVMVTVAAQPAQRLVIGAVAVPTVILAVVRTVRGVVVERREGTVPPSREAARRLPMVAFATFVFGWGLAFVWWQALSPKPALDSALVMALPFAIFPMIGLGETWKLRREMKREEQVEASPQ